MTKRLGFFLTAIILAVLTLGCGQKAVSLPSPAAIVVTTDADLRFALKRTHDLLDLTVDVIIKAKRFEEALLADPNAAPFVKAIHGKFVAGADGVLVQIRKLAVEIDTKVVVTWEAVQARVKPLIDQLNDLLAITATKGISWKDALIGAVNILGPLLAPGLPHIGLDPLAAEGR